MSFSRTHCIRVSSRSSRPRWVPTTRNSTFALTPAVTAGAPTSGASRPPSLARPLRRCRSGSPSRDPRMTADERGDARELSARVGETRRLTMMFCDVVGSTELSSRQDPETYRDLMGAYRGACRDVIESRFEGHIVQLKGDGALSSFGFPGAHENDTERAVLAGLALVRAVRELSTVTRSTVGESLEVRVGIHHGPVYVDLDEPDIYGLAANVAARLQTIADPGTVVVSDEVRALVDHRFEIEPGAPRRVRGVAEPLHPFRVIRERAVPVRRTWSTPLLEREAELELLLQAWARTMAGSAGGVLIHGEAGVGKSRLVAEFVDQARAPRIFELH